MKFVTAMKDEEIFVGIVINDAIVHLQKAVQFLQLDVAIPTSMQACIEMGDEFLQVVKQVEQKVEQLTVYTYNNNDVKLLAPIPRPKKNIFCVGKNYRDHAIEMGSAEDIPDHIMVFTKAPTTVIGPNEEIEHHSNVTNELDYEGELAVVIGKEGRGISKQEALNYVFGYTIVNDITARDLQSRHKQFFIGKSLDTTCPMGPSIIHKSLIENPTNLSIITKVNGEVRQSSTTEHFIFSIETIISDLSKGMTLEPGDIIATGTPAGVGKGFKPPRFLRKGDIIDITIEGIGTLTNTVMS